MKKMNFTHFWVKITHVPNEKNSLQILFVFLFFVNMKICKALLCPFIWGLHENIVQ
jgi:hypothetical protein